MGESDMANAQSAEPTRQKALRLWPGVLIVVLQWLAWFGLPFVAPEMVAGLVGALAMATGACGCGRSFARFDGGVVGRTDDVRIVRGINIVPSAIENLVRRFPEVGEFAVDLYRRHELDEMEVRIEVKNADPDAIAKAVGAEMRDGLGLRVLVTPVAAGSLPRFDLKARRLTDHRDADRE